MVHLASRKISELINKVKKQAGVGSNWLSNLLPLLAFSSGFSHF
jgi:hypothetical protein